MRTIRHTPQSVSDYQSAVRELAVDRPTYRSYPALGEAKRKRNPRRFGESRPFGSAGASLAGN